MANGLNAKKLTTISKFKTPDPLDAGSYPARLVQILLMGVQKNNPYKGEEKPPTLKVRLTYEMLDEFMKEEDGSDILDKPRWVSEDLPFLSLKADLAKSTKRYYALDPESAADGDWAQLLGSPCMVTLVQTESKGKTYNNVAAVSAMRPKEASKAPPLVNEGKIFDFYDPDMEVFEVLPEWIQDIIKGAVDFEGSKLEGLLSKGSPNTKKQEVAGKQQPSPEASEGVADDDSGDW